MRPRELTIEGFRSYRGATTFDWRDRRLVGIVGPIGAGKSSILDAVAFALYGKTPGIGSATKSLIHQQCTEAHVSLTFEVDGQIWQAVRAPKRKGQSGHQLRHLAADEPDAEVLETVTMEGAVNERIAHLLGMDFDTFCRSVLLAQNRFSDFLKATKTDRDKVLKGVFGFEQIDAAKLAAERRLDRETMALEAFAREREGIDQARERLEEARGLAEQTRSRLKAFEDCAPRVEELVGPGGGGAVRCGRGRRAGSTNWLGSPTPCLPASRSPPCSTPPPRPEAPSSRRRRPWNRRSEPANSPTPTSSRCASAWVIASNCARSSDWWNSSTNTAARSPRPPTPMPNANGSSPRRRELVEQRHAESTEAQESLARADDRLEEASAATKEAHDALATARHAEMAHELRGSLVAGEPCPVCAQPVATLPKRGAAPKAVSAAEKALAKAERAEADLRAEKERLATTVGAATKAVSETEARLEEGTALLEASTEELRGIEAELTAVQDRITERLGEGEPHELVKARESELEGGRGRRRRGGDRGGGRSSLPRGAAGTCRCRAGGLDHPGGGVRERVGRPGGSPSSGRHPRRGSRRVRGRGRGDRASPRRGRSGRHRRRRPGDRRCRGARRRAAIARTRPRPGLREGSCRRGRRPCRRHRQGRRTLRTHRPFR